MQASNRRIKREMANRESLIGDVLYFLKNLISSNVTDPIASARGSSSAFVMTSFPSRQVKYPLIVLEVANIEEQRAGMQTTAMDVDMIVQLRIWSLSVTQSDKLCQEILDLLADKQFTATGSVDNDFHDFNITSVNRVDEPGEAGTKSRIIQLSYRFFNT